jgi:kynurenine formamidase
LGHIGRDHAYYNNRKAADVVAPDGLKLFGTHALPGIVTRGVVLNMSQYFGQNPVPMGTAYTQQDLEKAALQQGVVITKGDVVLLHSGYMKANEDAVELVAGEPGLGVSGAHYLAKLGVVAVGADSWALEALPSEDPSHAFPVHQILLTKYGVYILENMVTHDLVADGVTEFMFTLGVPKLKGSVQAIINPLAIR